MKTRLTSPSDSAPTPDGFPDADSLAALRAWYVGLPAREAIKRYLPGSVSEGQSARGILGRIRRQLVDVARKHTDNMARLDKLANELDGKKCLDRVKDAGYRADFVGENIL